MKTSVDSAAVPVAEVAGMGSDGSPPLVPPGASAIGTEVGWESLGKRSPLSSGHRAVAGTGQGSTIATGSPSDCPTVRL